MGLPNQPCHWLGPDTGRELVGCFVHLLVLLSSKQVRTHLSLRIKAELMLLLKWKNQAMKLSLIFLGKSSPIWGYGYIRTRWCMERMLIPTSWACKGPVQPQEEVTERRPCQCPPVSAGKVSRGWIRLCKWNIIYIQPRICLQYEIQFVYSELFKILQLL